MNEVKRAVCNSLAANLIEYQNIRIHKKDEQEQADYLNRSLEVLDFVIGNQRAYTNHHIPNLIINPMIVLKPFLADNQSKPKGEKFLTFEQACELRRALQMLMSAFNVLGVCVDEPDMLYERIEDPLTRTMYQLTTQFFFHFSNTCRDAIDYRTIDRKEESWFDKIHL